MNREYVQAIIVRKENMNSFRVRKRGSTTTMTIGVEDFNKIAAIFNARVNDLRERPKTSALQVLNNTTGVRRHFYYNVEAASPTEEYWQCIEDPNIVLHIKHQ